MCFISAASSEPPGDYAGGGRAKIETVDDEGEEGRGDRGLRAEEAAGGEGSVCGRYRGR